MPFPRLVCLRLVCLRLVCLTGLALLAPLLAPLAAVAQPREGGSRIEVTVAGDTVTWVAHNTEFAYVTHNPMAPAERGLIVQFESQVTRSTAREGAEGTVRARAWRVKPDGAQEAAWEGAYGGHEAWISGERLMIPTYGCCGAGNSYTAVSAATGKVLYTASGPSPAAQVLSIEIPNTGPLGYRFVAVHGVYSATHETVLKSGNSLALITYASPAVPMQRIKVLQRKDGRIDDKYREVRMSWEADKPNAVQGGRLMLWQATGDREAAAVKGAALRLFIGDHNILLPVVGDRLDIKGGIVPSDVVLIEEPVN
ncbi:MAG: hypothetical protein AB7R90_18345 [Reyranellaceae bacterium]